jgi:hypothetical protein
VDYTTMIVDAIIGLTILTVFGKDKLSQYLSSRLGITEDSTEAGDGIPEINNQDEEISI